MMMVSASSCLNVAVVNMCFFNCAVPQLVPVDDLVQESNGIARPAIRLVNPIEMSFKLNYTLQDSTAIGMFSIWCYTPY